MNISEKEDDFPTHEWITPQSKVNFVYQSNSEKGIKILCCELLDLKDTVENFYGNSQSKYLAFQRILEEIAKMEHELIEFHKHASSQRIIVQDLMIGVCRELEEWSQIDGETSKAEEDPPVCDPLLNEVEIHRMAFLENIDVLLAEHKMEEALMALEVDEKSSSELNDSEKDTSSTEKLLRVEWNQIFGDMLVYTNRIVQWEEWEIESFIRLVKENAPSSEMVTTLCAASICVQASFNHCSILESQGLKLSKLLMVLLQPYVEEVLEMNFRRARSMLFNFEGNDDILPPQIISHFFDEYVEILIKALPGPSEDENLAENKEFIYYKAETDSQQLALLGTAFTVADELLPMDVSRIWSGQSELKELGSGPAENVEPATSATKFKKWKRHLQHSLDKLRDHFCR
ncbi:hypothetical protein GIB67_000338 [Kingdonia uniflora]|uniref:Uncharacterized protein n=1 Tax=Kingdonia uniflora TaxID=39325 RepID=A0A7J7LCN6_9MAGN|nr:hypothetical protein GIB67_000338 [Kingdonia uniflora]